MKIRKALLTLIAPIFLSSCDCSTPVIIGSIQDTDKKLACRDIILEINEAEHYRSLGEESKKITLGEMFMPTCWISGYLDGSKAYKSANSRIEYLTHIYDLLDCSGSEKPIAGNKPSLSPVPPRSFIDKDRKTEPENNGLKPEKLKRQAVNRKLEQKKIEQEKQEIKKEKIELQKEKIELEKQKNSLDKQRTSSNSKNTDHDSPFVATDHKNNIIDKLPDEDKVDEDGVSYKPIKLFK